MFGLPTSSPATLFRASRFDPVARNILHRNPWKPQNSAGTMTASGPINNLVLPTKGRYYLTRYDWKVDHHFNPSNRLFGGSRTCDTASVGRFSNEPLWELVDPQFTIPIDQSNVVISDTHTFNPTTINEFRFGQRRHRTRRPATQDGNWAQQLGIPNVSPETFPEIRALAARYYNFGPGGWMSS